MFTYEKKQIGRIFLKELNRIVDPCDLYEIKKEEKLVASLYSSAELSLAVLPDRVFRIDREQKFFQKRRYRMFDRYNELVALFEFPLGQPSADGAVYFKDGPVYSLIEKTDHRRLLKVHTWGLYRFDMSDSEILISFFGTRLQGHILPDNEAHLVPIISGMFIVDEKFRRQDESPD